MYWICLDILSGKVLSGHLLMMMMIANNSRARKGGKERGEVKGEYGGISGMMR